MLINFVTDQMEGHKPKHRDGELVSKTERGPQDRHGGYEDMEMGRGNEGREESLAVVLRYCLHLHTLLCIE